MNSIAKEISNYWVTQNAYFVLDPPTLDRVVSSLSDEEKVVVGRGKDECFTDEELRKEYLFAVNKAFNRHNDIIQGSTIIEDDGTILLSPKSSISELEITFETLMNCNRSCIYHIEDINKEALPSLTFESIANVTAAVLKYTMQTKG